MTSKSTAVLPSWIPAPVGFSARNPDAEIVRSLAYEAGLEVAAITESTPFGGMREFLETHIDERRMEGLDWFDKDRARVASSPSSLHDTARSVISVGLPFYTGPQEKPDDGTPRGRVARYAWGRDYHKVLKRRMKSLLELLECHVGRPIESRLLVDTARIVDRAVAARSGLGWYGKHTCIIVPGHGSWVMLGELVLDIDLEPTPPLLQDCGSCSQCLDRCPTGAIVAPYTVDTPRCISFQTIEQREVIPLDIRGSMGEWVFGCDVCQDVCPYTAAAKHVHDADFAPASIEHVFPSLRRLLLLSEEQFLDQYRGTAIMRAKRKGMARNAAVALGNLGDAAETPFLDNALNSHDEAIVRGHAAWALGEIGGRSARTALERSARSEASEYVLLEIEAALDQG